MSLPSSQRQGRAKRSERRQRRRATRDSVTDIAVTNIMHGEYNVASTRSDVASTRSGVMIIDDRAQVSLPPSTGPVNEHFGAPSFFSYR